MTDYRQDYGNSFIILNAVFINCNSFSSLAIFKDSDCYENNWSNYAMPKESFATASEGWLYTILWKIKWKFWSVKGKFKCNLLINLFSTGFCRLLL